MSENNIEEEFEKIPDFLSELEELEDLLADTEDDTDMLQTLEESITEDDSDMDLDLETQSFLSELSDFLDEEEEKYDSEYEMLPSLDELDDEIPDFTNIEDEYQEYNKTTNNYEVDDPETAEIRANGANVALGLMNYVEFNVVTLENELTILGEAFNQLLDKTHELDDKIAKLSEKINKAKIEGSKQALTFIHDEIKLISDNLEGAIKSTDPNDYEVLQENVLILSENKVLIEEQIKGLREIGASTDKLEHDLKVLDMSIVKLKSAINSNKTFSLSSIISNEIKQVISQMREARKAEDEHDISLLQENFDLLMDNKFDIEEKIWALAEKDIDIEGLKEQFEILYINLEQFSRTIDDTVYQLSMRSRKKK